MALIPAFFQDGLQVHWLHGGLYLEYQGEGLVLDAPPEAVPELERLGAMPHVHSLMLSSGRTRAVGGLVSLLCALERYRGPGAPLSVRSMLGEERGPALAGAWLGAWQRPYPLLVDAIAPGSPFETGAFEVTPIPVRHGEPRWGPVSTVEPAPGHALRVCCDAGTVAWVPGAAPGPQARRACQGALLAVVEVGAEPWPQSNDRWRMTVSDALEAAQAAEETWLVADDGGTGLPGARDAS